MPTGSTKLKTASGEEVKADRGKFVQVRIIVIGHRVEHDSHSFDHKQDDDDDERQKKLRI